MTQKQRVLKMLQDAGSQGVRSDAFLRAYMPRAAARILELRAEGYDITSEPENGFCRYTLARVRTIEGRTRKERLIEPSGSPDSGESNGPSSGSSGVMTAKPGSGVKDRRSRRPSPVPSMFDADDHLDWGAAA